MRTKHKYMFAIHR